MDAITLMECYLVNINWYFKVIKGNIRLGSCFVKRVKALFLNLSIRGGKTWTGNMKTDVFIVQLKTVN
jgi:hypothetical protein